MLFNSLSLFVGLRFNQAKKRGSLFSLVSVISTAGIALGIAVLIIGLSAMNGFESELKHRVLAVVPHGEIFIPDQPLQQWQPVVNQLKKVDGVVTASPYVSFTALLENRNQLRSLQIRAVIPKEEEQQSALPQYVNQSDWQHFSQNHSQIIIGKGLAQELQLKPGDWVTALIPDMSNQTLKFVQPKRVRLQVAGLLELSGDLGYKFGLIHLTEGQKITRLGDAVTGIAINVNNVFAANQIVHRAANQLDLPVRAKSWIQEYGFMYRDIQMIRMIMYIAMVLVIGVACFNIISTLIISVKDRKNDIAILKTLGARDSLIRAVFVWYGFVSGLSGVAIGVILGVVIALNLTGLIQFIESVTGIHLLAADIYFIDFLPSEIHVQDVLLVSITALILSLLASWYPASRAAAIQPARILSGQ